LDVQAFQAAHGLTADGIIGPATWSALLRYRIARVRWSVSQPHDTATVTSAAIVRNRGATGASPLVQPLPKSASLPAKRNEIPAGLGRGRP
ncbi:MAG TPA: peptidoglycan-binding domain-containing protein, partial [Solirubrobacteraceae bacterium]|nr:peptidoglycan-binding domain-containing protein [Solirubrobacteraceae bacterium]